MATPSLPLIKKQTINERHFTEHIIHFNNQYFLKLVTEWKGNR